MSRLIAQKKTRAEHAERVRQDIAEALQQVAQRDLLAPLASQHERRV